MKWKCDTHRNALACCVEWKEYEAGRKYTDNLDKLKLQTECMKLRGCKWVCTRETGMCARQSSNVPFSETISGIFNERDFKKSNKGKVTGWESNWKQHLRLASEEEDKTTKFQVCLLQNFFFFPSVCPLERLGAENRCQRWCKWTSCKIPRPWTKISEFKGHLSSQHHEPGILLCKRVIYFPGDKQQWYAKVISTKYCQRLFDGQFNLHLAPLKPLFPLLEHPTFP